MKPLVAVIVALALALPASAAQAPTIEATPSTVGMLSQVSLSGVAPSAKAGTTVFVEAKECRSSFFRVVAATQAGAGGAWATSAPAQITTSYRARVRGTYSRQVLVRKRAVLTLSKLPNGRLFQVKSFGGGPLIGRMVRIERLTSDGWVLVQRAKLRQSDIFGVVETTVRIRRKGLRLRALITLAQARPCYVAGASTVITS
jgi:hypothetical protein